MEMLYDEFSVTAVDFRADVGHHGKMMTIPFRWGRLITLRELSKYTKLFNYKIVGQCIIGNKVNVKL